MATRPVDDATIQKEMSRWNSELYRGSVRAAAKALGIPRERLRQHMRMAKARGMEVKPALREDNGIPALPVAVRPLAEFQATNDKKYIVPKKIKTAIELLGDGWLYEGEFARLAGIGMVDLTRFRTQFEDHVVSIRREGGKRVWAGKATAAKMREMLK